MKIIVPTTNVNLISSNVAEPKSPEVLWNAATAYSIGDEVIRTTTHKKYKRIIAGTTATAPENDTVNWLDIGSNARWFMFDDVVGTVTTNSLSIDVSIQTEGVSGIYLAGLSGRTLDIELLENLGGAVVYSKTIDLDGTIITSFYDWFFNPFELLEDVVVSDLPYHFTSSVLNISISGTGNVSCGVMKYGVVYDIGMTQYGATSSIVDYSKKEVDDFGNYYILERAFAKKANFEIFTYKQDYNKISKVLQQVRAKPAVYIGTEIQGYEPLVVYGFYKDFSINVSYPTMHNCSLEVEGLT